MTKAEFLNLVEPYRPYKTAFKIASPQKISSYGNMTVFENEMISDGINYLCFEDNMYIINPSKNCYTFKKIEGKNFPNPATSVRMNQCTLCTKESVLADFKIENFHISSDEFKTWQDKFEKEVVESPLEVAVETEASVHDIPAKTTQSLVKLKRLLEVEKALLLVDLLDSGVITIIEEETVTEIKEICKQLFSGKI